MSVKRTVVKSCCGGKNSSIVLHTDKPIKASQIFVFEQAGYTMPPHYTTTGIFYARKEGLVSTGSYGTTKITVKVSEANKEEKLTEFETLLEIAINS